MCTPTSWVILLLSGWFTHPFWVYNLTFLSFTCRYCRLVLKMVILYFLITSAGFPYYSIFQEVFALFISIFWFGSRIILFDIKI
jgi:hypothetical protein